MVKAYWANNKKLFYVSTVPLFLLLLVISVQLIFESYHLTYSNDILKSYISAQSSRHDLQEIEILKRKILERVQLYEQQIKKHHLKNGMLVNRRVNGEVIDQCDSLLFSSIRYVALKKLGYTQKAEVAWEAISKNQNEGKWFRHPTCRHHTSRDMIVGLLIALSQFPLQGKKNLQQFFNYVEKNSGYFGDGPIYVSYLSPGLAESFRRLSKLHNIEDFPKVVQFGFSTLEIDSFFIDKGYRSHLVALQIWLELETQILFAQKGLWRGPRSFMWEIGKFFSPFTMENMYQQRREWLAQKLLEVDPKNLFFRWLRLKSAGMFDQKAQVMMMKELLAMPQFPEQQLPMNCHRKADYLWQRGSDEFEPGGSCSMKFNGVDFLWMASLLFDQPSKIMIGHL